MKTFFIISKFEFIVDVRSWWDNILYFLRLHTTFKFHVDLKFAWWRNKHNMQNLWNIGARQGYKEYINITIHKIIKGNTWYNPKPRNNSKLKNQWNFIIFYILSTVKQTDRKEEGKKIKFKFNIFRYKVCHWFLWN